MKTPLTVVAPLLLVGACSVPPDRFEPSASPLPTVRPPVATATATDPPESASDLLECDGPASPVGGRADDFGPDGAGQTPDEAFEAWVTATPFVVPHSGYRRLSQIGDRFVYVYEADDRVKVVVVISPRFGELVNAPFTIEELRTCDPSEFGATVDLGPNQRVWVHEVTGAILHDIAGPGHCEWQSARMLHLTKPDGSLDKQYLRDPEGVVGDSPSLLETYAEGVELPDDATFSGYQTDDGLELWFTPEDRAAYVVTPDTVERWPRADPPIGCA